MAKVLEVGEIIEPNTLAQFAGSWSQLWDIIERQSRASLEWWLLFVNTFGIPFLISYPIYKIDLDQSALLNLGKELAKCKWPRPPKVHLIVEVGGQLDTQLVQKILNIRNVNRLDLHGAVLDTFSLRAIRQSIEYGALRGLEQLCLPKRGPSDLKPLLDRSWPRSLKYIESPRKAPGLERTSRTHTQYAIHIKINIQESSTACRSHAYKVNG